MSRQNNVGRYKWNRTFEGRTSKPGRAVPPSPFFPLDSPTSRVITFLTNSRCGGSFSVQMQTHGYIFLDGIKDVRHYESKVQRQIIRLYTVRTVRSPTTFVENLFSSSRLEQHRACAAECASRRFPQEPWVPLYKISLFVSPTPLLFYTLTPSLLLSSCTLTSVRVLQPLIRLWGSRRLYNFTVGCKELCTYIYKNRDDSFDIYILNILARGARTVLPFLPFFFFFFWKTVRLHGRSFLLEARRARVKGCMQGVSGQVTEN